MSLIVTGSIGLDTVITPTGRADEVLGGSCTYFAAGASYFTRVRLVAAVGDDFGDEQMKVFDLFDIDTMGLERRAGSKTFRWTGKYMENMNERETLDVQVNILEESLPTIPAEWRDSEYVFLANTHPVGQLELREQLHNAKLVVADTMDLYLTTAMDEFEEVLKKIDGLVLNDSEARRLTGESDMVVAGGRILEMGPGFVVIKKGEHGCLLIHGEGMAALPAYPTKKVVDPTGAGDSFAGGMMGYLTSVDRTDIDALRTALAYGTVVASYNIESFTLGRMMEITREDIDERLAELAVITRFGL